MDNKQIRQAIRELEKDKSLERYYSFVTIPDTKMEKSQPNAKKVA